MKSSTMKSKDGKESEARQCDSQTPPAMSLAAMIDRAILRPLFISEGICGPKKMKRTTPVKADKTAADPLVMIGTHLPNTTDLDTAMINMLMTPPSLKPSLGGVIWRRRLMKMPEHSTAPPLNSERKNVDPLEKRVGEYKINTTEPLMPLPNKHAESKKHKSRLASPPVTKKTDQSPVRAEDVSGGVRESSSGDKSSNRVVAGAEVREKAAMRVTPQLIKDKEFIGEMIQSVDSHLHRAQLFEAEAEEEMADIALKCALAEEDRRVADRLARECIELDKTVAEVEEQRKEQLRALKAGFHDAVREVPIETTLTPIELSQSPPCIPSSLEVIILPDIADRSELPLGDDLKAAVTQNSGGSSSEHLVREKSKSKKHKKGSKHSMS